MAVSYRSASFQEAYKKLQEENEQGLIKSGDDVSRRLNELGYDFSKEEFQDAIRKQKTEVGKDADPEDLRAETTAIGRTVGRTLGEVGGALVTFGEIVLPESVENVIGEAADSLGEALPESFKELSSEFFDPYHGSGLQAGGEEIVGTIASFIIPGTGIIKGVNAASKTAKAMSPGARAVMTNSARKLSGKQRKIAQATGRGTAYAAGATLVAPEENIANLIVEEFPDAEEYLERLASNPDDSEAEKILKTFATNLGIGAVFAPLAVANAYKRPISKAVGAAFKPLNKVKDILPKIKMPANFSSRMGTDDTILQAAVERSGAARAATLRAEGLAKDLKAAVKKEYGKETPEVIEKINQALSAKTGRSGFVTGLKPETRKLVQEMRDNIDTLSKEVIGSAKGELKGKISKGLGTYITRSYDLFDDPTYAKNMRKKWERFTKSNFQDDPQGVFQNAIDDLAKAGVKEPRAALAKLINKEKTDDGVLGVLSSLTAHSGSAQSAKSGMKRNENLPQSVRDLFGEVKDPYGNYVKTFSNLSEITSQQRYAKDVADHLLSKGLARKTDTDGTMLASLSDTTSDKMSMIFGGKGAAQLDNPLQGLYTTDVYKKAIQEGLDLARPDGLAMKTFMTAKGISQAAKTVYSPITHGRNVMGNTFMLMANGMLPGTKMKQAASAIMPKSITRRLLNKSNKELADTYARYVELGIANSGLGVNIVRRNLAAFDGNPEAWLKNKSVVEAGKKLNKGVTDLYQAEDDLFKIAHFEKTLDYIKRSDKYKSLPLKEQERIAAQRTRDLMPNYNLVPKALKSLRGSVFGDFLSFPAEMARISKNLVKYTLDDLTSGDAVLARQAAKRAAGITAVGVAGDALSDFSRSLAGIDDEQEEAINNVVPQWEFNQDRIYLSGIDEDERGHKGVDYINLGPIDPFAYIKTAGKGMHSLIAAGIDPNSDVTSAELSKVALGTLDSTLGPFLDTSMITDALIESSTKLKEIDKAPTAVDGIADALSPMVDLFTPGFVDLLERRADYNKSIAQKQELAGQPSSRSLAQRAGLSLRDAPPGIYPEKSFLAQFPEGEVDLAASFGMKRQRLDLTAGMNFAVRPLLGEIKGAGSGLYDLLNKSNLMQEDQDKIVSEYVDAQKQTLKGYEKLRALMKNYQSLFGDEYDNEINKGLTMRGDQIFTDADAGIISNAMFVNPFTGEDRGYFEPFVLKDRDIYESKGTPIPWQRLDDIYQMLNGNAIDVIVEENE
tara:strand:+ start:8020 stop:11739 length:3720 start_codon:yes stop_codon:yes gene_type:complete